MGNNHAEGVDSDGCTLSGGGRRGTMKLADHVLVFMCRCAWCGRLDHDGPSWNHRADAPVALPPCRCGGAQTLVQLDVNEALPRLP